ncbi:DUF5673 domain-containing protein [uncultured Clostridium sp.]|uniref:DUF5673 domain-containing protein n=1 Tax=uncultured Clostridium sp. TaxID=59620 RepID=UPI0028E56EF7|nr:DUF5673 domain-containing protein [uncultured Clostridium sp.]
MDTSTIFLFIFILAVDIMLIVKDVRSKLIISGNKKFKVIIPVMIVVFIIMTLRNSTFGIENIIVCIGILPLAFVGNKTGITENGFLFNSYVTPWDKVESYSLKEQGEKYVLSFKTNIGIRKIFFKLEHKDEVKKYLSGIRKLKYVI